MFTSDQLIAHAVGDYLIQSHWMATNKTKSHWAALAHVVTYAVPFMLLFPSAWALGVIITTHFVIDRWRLARFVVWAKNIVGAPKAEAMTMLAEGVTATGYPAGTPDWLAVWLLIIADNLLHIVINGLALRYL